MLAEAIQTALRVSGDKNAYEKIKDATRGVGAMDEEGYKKLVEATVTDAKLKKSLLLLAPDAYIGESVRLALHGSRGGATNRKGTSRRAARS